MKTKLLKSLLVTLTMLSLFVLFSCGESNKNKDVLKEDAIEQLNESINDLKDVILIESEEISNVNLDSMLNHNFSLDNIELGELLDYEIDSIAVKDGILYLGGLNAPGLLQPKNFAAKIYDSEIVLFELLGHGARENVIPINSETPDIDIDSIYKIFDSLLIDKEDLEETDHAGKFKLKKKYFDTLAEAFGASELQNMLGEVDITVDTTKYESAKEILFTITVASEEMTLTVVFDKANGVRTLRILMESGEEEDYADITMKTKDGELVAFSLDAGTSEDYIILEFKLKEKKSDLKGLKKQSVDLKLVIVDPEMSVDVETSGAIYENKNGNLAKLELDITAKEDEKELLAAYLLYDESLMKKADKEGLVISAELYDVDLDDIKDGITTLSAKAGSDKGESSVKLRLKTEKYTESEKSYKLALEISDGETSKTGGAKLNIPAKNVSVLTREEQAVIEKRDTLGENSVGIAKKAAIINQQAIDAINNGYFNPKEYLYRVYTYDKSRGAYFFTDVTIVGGQYYVTTRAIADYESYLPMYAENLYSFSMFKKSAAANALEKIVAQTDAELNTDSYRTWKKDFISYVYLEEYGCYAFMNQNSPKEAVLTTEKPTADMFGGTVLHEIKKTDDGYTAHNFDFVAEDNCILCYTCSDCETVFRSKNPIHFYEEKVEQKAGVSNGDCELLSCINCDEMLFKYVETNGTLVTVNISPARQSNLEEIRYNTELGDYTLPDVNEDLFISAINYDMNSDKPATICIPQLAELYDYKIVGVLNRFHYNSNTSDVEFVLPDGLELVLASAFENCKVSKITLPDSLIYIGYNAFRSCAVQELTIPKNVRYIADSAFLWLYNLNKMVINSKMLDSLPPIEAGALRVLEINYPIKHFSGFSECYIEEFTIPDGVETVGGGFTKNHTIKKIVLSETVKEIYTEAFYDCSELREILFNESLEKIGDSAFRGCDALTKVVLNEGLTEMGISAFEGCVTLKSVVLPKTLKVISDSAFHYCYALEEVDFASVVTIGELAFASAALKELKLNEGLEKIGNNAFISCRSLESVYIPKTVTVIPFSAFTGCLSLKTVELHDGITEIQRMAFESCILLESIGDVSGVKIIGADAFNSCGSLTDEDFCFGDSLESIGSNAFAYCGGLKNIVIPKNLTAMSNDAFYGCTFETVRFECAYSFGELSHTTIGEVTYLNEIKSKITFGTVTNIYDSELPEPRGSVTNLPTHAEVINFAGGEEEFLKWYSIPNASVTVVNYNVAFEEAES